MTLTARLAIAPIAWTNDDLPELGGDTPLETCLTESRQAGYRGTETGGKFPKSAAELGPLLERHGLRLVSGWYSGTVLDNDLEAEKAKARAQLELFRALGAAVIVYGETAGTIQNRREVPLARRRTLTGDAIKAYGERLTAFAEWCRGEGVAPSCRGTSGRLPYRPGKLARQWGVVYSATPWDTSPLGVSICTARTIGTGTPNSRRSGGSLRTARHRSNGAIFSLRWKKYWRARRTSRRETSPDCT